MLKLIVLVGGLLLMQGSSAVAIECYTCTNTSSIPDCNTAVKCPNDTVCASEYTTINGKRVYKLGCKDILTCPLTPTVTQPSIVGRSLATPANCTECCHSNFCNRQLCQDPDPRCADDKTVNCGIVGTITNICDDASHIRPYCRRFCGFCNTVDGGWSHWSQWSICSVTCGNGTRARSRTCSDPPPTNGGSDCLGAKHEQGPCSKELCPVHGGWSGWSDWGSCSASCDIGLQRRDRTCSNPYPSRTGDHCYGESRDDRLCFPGACANGSWSSWGAWGACSRSCGGGVKTRSRDCNSPAPSLTGKDCAGDPMQAESCSFSPCHDGSWSSWGAWGACSRSCGGGVKTRGRHCAPSMIGKDCAGDPMQAESCSFSPCHALGFSVKSHAQSPTSRQLTFTTVVTNPNNIYNTTTGVFTCRIPGNYYFSASLQKEYSYNGAAVCYIRKNGNSLVQAYSAPGASPYKGDTAAVTTVYIHLATGDKVTLGGCSPASSFNSESSFSSFLVTADVA